jgi:hypothetical protein
LAVNLEHSIRGRREPGGCRSGLKWLDKVSDVAREHRPDGSGKSSVTRQRHH